MKKNHSCLLIFTLLFPFLWIIAGWNTYNWDWDPYVLLYENSADISQMSFLTTLDFGYAYIGYFFNLIGLTFIQYRQILYLIFLSFIFIYICKESNRPILVSILYICCMYFRDIILCRNTIAMIFLYVGLHFLLSNKPQSKILFVIFITIASTIHISFVFYFFLLLKDKSVNFYILFVITMASSMIACFIFTHVLALSIFSEIDAMQEKGEDYLANNSLVSWIFCGFYYMLTYFTLHSVKKKICVENRGPICIVNKESTYLFNISNALKIFTWSLPILAFTIINMQFARLYYNLFLFLTICIINETRRICNSQTSLIIFTWVLLHFVWQILMSGVKPQISIILENNLLL